MNAFLKPTSAILIAVLAAALAVQTESARAANYVMTGNDGVGMSSFNTGLNWPGGLAPEPGNTYQTANFLLRTPSVTGSSFTFAGDSLEVQAGGTLRNKTQAGTITIDNLILAEGAVVELSQPGNPAVNNNTALGELAGNITLNGLAVLRAGNANDAAGETFIIRSTLSGTGGLITSGSTGNLILAATNTHTGPTIAGGGTLVIGWNDPHGLTPMMVTNANSVLRFATNIQYTSAYELAISTANTAGSIRVDPGAVATFRGLTGGSGGSASVWVGGGGTLRLTNATTTFGGLLRINDVAVVVDDNTVVTNVNNNNGLQIGSGALSWAPAGATGTFTLRGNAKWIQTLQGVRIGSDGNGATGVLQVQDDAVFSTPLIYLPRQGNNTGIVHQVGGTVTTAEIRGGSSFSPGNWLGVYNLDGGTLEWGGVFAAGPLDWTESMYLNLNGGTLRLTADAAINGWTAINVFANGAVIDTMDHSVAIDQPLMDGDGQGGGLTKLGSGTLTLNGMSYYTGPTLVAGGKLILGNLLAAPNHYSVADNAGLGVKAPYLNAQVIVGNVTLGQGGATTLDFDLQNFGNPSMAMMDVTGTLQVNSTVTVNVKSEVPGIGEVPLLHSAQRTGSGSFVVGELPVGVQGYVTFGTPTYPNTLVLVVTQAGSPRWAGMLPDFTVDGTWDINDTMNWIEMTTLGPTAYREGNPVLFDDSAIGTTTINLVTTVHPGSVTFANEFLSYVLSGTGSISGDTGLRKAGAGDLTISNRNEYTGPTVIESGRLVMAGSEARSMLVLTNAETTVQFSANHVSTEGLALSSRAGHSGETVLVDPGVQATLRGLHGGNDGHSTWFYGGGALRLVDSTSLYQGRLRLNDFELIIDSGAVLSQDSASVFASQIGSGAVPNVLPGSTGILTVQGDGQYIQTAQGLRLGSDANGATGILNVRDEGWVSVPLLYLPRQSGNKGIVNQVGGTVTVPTISGGHSGDSVDGQYFWQGIYNLQGGVLEWSGVIGAGTGPVTPDETLVLNLNGGTLRLTTNATISGWTAINVLANGAVIDTMDHQVVFGQPLLPGDAFNGGLVKLGGGSLILPQTNSYRGVTTINGGTLVVTPAHQATNGVFVSDGATYCISLPGAVETVTNGFLTLGEGSTTLRFELGTNGNPTVPLLVTGSITNHGSLNVALGGSTARFTTGAFPLVKYGANSIIGSDNNPIISGPNGMSITLSNDSAGSMLYAVVTSLGSGIVWTGTNSLPGLTNLWDLDSATNWVVDGKPTTYQEPFAPGDAVTFNDSGSGLVLLSNTVSPSSMTISNINVTYTFEGSGRLSGPMTLNKQGSGTATIGFVGNDYTGSTVISGGTLSVFGGQAIGNASDVVLADVAHATLAVTNSETIGSLAGGGPAGGNVIIEDGALTLAAGDRTTVFGGRISGSGSLRLTGNNTMLTLSGDNTYSGGTTIGASQGSAVLRVDSDTALGTGTVTFDTAGNASTARLEIWNGRSLANSILLAGRNNPSIAIQSLNGNNTILGAISLASGGEFYRIHVNAGSELTLGTQATTAINSAATGSRIVTLEGEGTGVVAGPIVDGSATLGVVKAGPGTWTLSNVNFYTGPTTVLEGTLLVNGSTSLGAVTVEGGALGGTGTIGGAVTVNSGGTLAPGDGVGTLSINGALTLDAGATSVFEVNGSTQAHDVVAAGSTVTYGGILRIVPSGVFSKGQTFALFTGAGAASASNFASIEGNPGNGLAFAFSNGVLSVVEAPVGPVAALLTNSISGNNLSLSWPAGEGWRLQMQITDRTLGLRDEWVDITDGSVSSTNITISPAHEAVFFRLVNP